MDSHRNLQEIEHDVALTDWLGVTHQGSMGMPCSDHVLDKWSNQSAVTLIKEFWTERQLWINMRTAERITLPSMPYVRLVITDDFRIRAKAIVLEHRHFIVVSAGAILNLHDIFFKILSCKTLLSHIGDPSAESTQVEIVSGNGDSYLNTSLADRLSPSSNDPFSLPRDPKRLYVGSKMAGITSRFLLAHELAHHRYGDLEMRASAKYRQWKSDFLAGSPGPEYLQRYCEIHADSWATGKATFEYFWDARSRNFIFKEDEILEWLFSLYILFRVQGFPLDPPDDLFTGAHPIPSVRLLLAYNVLISHFHRGQHIEAEEKAMLNVQRALEIGEATYSALTAIDFKNIPIGKAFKGMSKLIDEFTSFFETNKTFLAGFSHATDYGFGELK